MYKIFLIVVFLNCMNLDVFSQEKLSTFSFINERNSINETGMYVLGGWALANIVSGTIGNFSAKGKTKYFHQFNAIWNSVNLGISIFSLSTISNEILSLSDSFYEYNNLQNILLLNAGLDIAYTITGFYLKERSKSSNTKKDLLLGYGNSLILQGTFLLVFDLILYFVHQNNAEINLFPLINIVNDSIGIKLNINL